MEPCAGITPVPLRGWHGHPEQRRRFLKRKTGEVAKLDKFGLTGVVLCEPVKRLMDREQFISVYGRCELHFLKLKVFQTAPMLRAFPAACAIHEDAAHGFGGGTEKVRAVLESLLSQPQPRFVDQGGGLECLAGAFSSHFGSGDPAQLSMNRLHQRFAGPWNPLACGVENLRDIIPGISAIRH